MVPWQQEVADTGELYRVGGSVRDELLDGVVRDEEIDYVVRRIEPSRLEAILKRWGRVSFVGKSFGVYKFRPRGSKCVYDIAFPRTERSTGVGHRDFDVQWDPELTIEADLGRRDFTINAMARRVPEGKLVDPYGGAQDLALRRLKMIFPEAFVEDPLRILRGVRFTARFALSVEGETYRTMRDSATLLATVSVERVQEELTKLLTQCPKPSVGLALLEELGGLIVILPELSRGLGVEQNEHHPDDVFWHSLKSCDCAPREQPLVRWAALLHDVGKVDAKTTVTDRHGADRVVFYGHEQAGAEIAVRILKRLRFPGEFVERCRVLIAYHMADYRPEWSRSAVRRFMRNVGNENLDAMFELKKADVLSRGLDEDAGRVEEFRSRVAEEIAARTALSIEDLAVDGRMVMQVMGLEEGRAVGRVLAEMLEAVTENPDLNDRARLIEWLRAKKDAGKSST